MLSLTLHDVARLRDALEGYHEAEKRYLDRLRAEAEAKAKRRA